VVNGVLRTINRGGRVNGGSIRDTVHYFPCMEAGSLDELRFCASVLWCNFGESYNNLWEFNNQLSVLLE